MTDLDTLIARLQIAGEDPDAYDSYGNDIGRLVLEAAEALIALHQQCENRSPDGDGHEKGSVVAGGISEPAIPSAPQEPLKLSNTGAGSEPADSLSLQTLIARWRDAAEQASRRSAECDARGFDGENAHAFRKERRIWTTCADELAALQTSAPPTEQLEPRACMACGHDVKRHNAGYDCEACFDCGCAHMRWPASAPPAPEPQVGVKLVEDVYRAPEPQDWQPIATAGKGSWLTGPNDTRHPDYVEPPRLWLLLEDGESCVGYADAYYAEGGSGYDGGSYWVEKFSSERVNPTHWMPLPAPPKS